MDYGLSREKKRKNALFFGRDWDSKALWEELGMET
jgi:hypothetical protein